MQTTAAGQGASGKGRRAIATPESNRQRPIRTAFGTTGEPPPTAVSMAKSTTAPGGIRRAARDRQKRVSLGALDLMWIVVAAPAGAEIDRERGGQEDPHDRDQDAEAKLRSAQPGDRDSRRRDSLGHERRRPGRPRRGELPARARAQRPRRRSPPLARVSGSSGSGRESNAAGLRSSRSGPRSP